MGTHGLWGFEYDGILYMFANWYDSYMSDEIALPQIYNIMKKYKFETIIEMVKLIIIVSEKKFINNKTIKKIEDDTGGPVDHPEYELVFSKIEEFGNILTLKYGEFLVGDYQYEVIWNLNFNVVSFNTLKDQNLITIDVLEYIAKIDSGEKYIFLRENENEDEYSDKDSPKSPKSPKSSHNNFSIEVDVEIKNDNLAKTEVENTNFFYDDYFMIVSTSQKKETITDFFNLMYFKQHFDNFNYILELFKILDIIITKPRLFDIKIYFNIQKNIILIKKINSHILIQITDYNILKIKDINLTLIDDFLINYEKNNICKDSDYYDMILNEYNSINPLINTLFLDKKL